MTELRALFEKVREALLEYEQDVDEHATAEVKNASRLVLTTALDEIAERQHVDRCDCHRLWPRDGECAALRSACRGEK